MDTVIAYVVKDSLNITHLTLMGTRVTICGLSKEYTTPSFGKVSCMVCKGHVNPQTNGGH
jgi:hypothetical protein